MQNRDGALEQSVETGIKRNEMLSFSFYGKAHFLEITSSVKITR